MSQLFRVRKPDSDWAIVADVVFKWTGESWRLHYLVRSLEGDAALWPVDDPAGYQVEWTGYDFPASSEGRGVPAGQT